MTIALAALLSLRMGWAQEDLRPSLNFCNQAFVHAATDPWQASQVVNLSQLKSRLAPQEMTGLKDYFLKMKARNDELREAAHAVTFRSTSQGEKYYSAIKDQVPREGYVRALSVKEVFTIFKDGGMGSGYDFNFRGDGARVGHNGKFVFLVCRHCPESWFTDGNLGSGVINTHSIPLVQLEVVIPAQPAAR